MAKIHGKSSFLWHKTYTKELFLALFIFFSPFLIYVHLLFDNEVQAINIFGFSINHRFRGNATYIFMILRGLLPLMLLLVWFFKSRYKWRYLILLPAFPYIRTLIRIFFNPYLDKYGIHIMLAIFICLGIVVLFDFIYSKREENRISLENNFEYYLNLKSKQFYNTLTEKLYGIRNQRKSANPSEYLKNIYHIKTVLRTRYRALGLSKFPVFKLNNKAISAYAIFSLIGVYILYRLNFLLDKEALGLDIGFFTIGKFGFETFHIFYYFLVTKFTILIPLCVWYSISRNWWKYALLAPIFLYTYQIWEMFQDTGTIDGWENARVFPIIFIVLLALIFISRTIRYESKIMDVQEQIVDEIEDLLQKQEDEERVRKDKFALERLRVEVASNEAKQQQLDALLSLKQRLEDRLLEK